MAAQTMKTPNINTFKEVIPVIYCYTTPGVPAHNGWCKIGETEQSPEPVWRSRLRPLTWKPSWNGRKRYF